jgi:GNAT superfamily N-acetyltransferase
MKRTIEIHSLEMTSPQDLRPARPPAVELEIRQARIPCPELSRFLYTAVGGEWFWIDRLSWTYGQWLAWLDRPELETWIGYVQGTPAGYFELERQPGGAAENVELAYFGLIPQFIGRGLGGALLTAAVERAWAIGASRVWVHTCSLDGPASLANYQARGFRIFKTERLEKDFPAETPGPWPGARRSVF